MRYYLKFCEKNENRYLFEDISEIISLEEPPLKVRRVIGLLMILYKGKMVN